MPIFYLCFAALLTTAAAAQSLSGYGQGRIRLFEGTNSELRIQINGADATLPITKDGVSLTSKQDALEIRTSAQPALIDATALGRWTAEIPARSTAIFLATAVTKHFRFESPASNPAPLRLSFSDKASAELLPGSTADLDIFADDTYSLRASTNVLAITADGQKLNLSCLQPPMPGGGLKEFSDVRGNSRFQRSTPAIILDLSGRLDGAIHVKSPGSDLTLIAEQEKQLTFANGTKLILKHAAARQTLEWRVIKGLCQFRIDGFNCWKSTATSGQSGALQWNPIRKIIDLSNTSEIAPVFVQLSGRVHASIGPAATFQYAQFQDCGSFTTSATGGEVFLVDRETAEITPVVSGVSFSEGERVGSQVTNLPWHPFSFGWSSESRVEFRNTSGIIPLDLGRDTTLRFGKGELDVKFSAEGNLVLRAAAGNIELSPAFIPNFSLQLQEGAAIVATLHRRRHTFSVKAAPDSAASTRVVAAGQTYMFLSGEAKISVKVGQNTFIPETGAAWIFFEGAGGESTFTSGLQPAPPIRPDRFDASRIFQQPVSVIE